MLNPAEIRDMNMAAQDQAITGVHPALHLARAVEAATLATVTPLVQQLADALELIVSWNRDHARDQYGDPMKAETWACVRKARESLKPARAFLSGATKESTDHG